MSIVKDSLTIAGQDPISDLYEFIEKRQRLAEEDGGFADWLMYTRILTELSLAVVTYAAHREKDKCQESKS